MKRLRVAGGLCAAALTLTVTACSSNSSSQTSASPSKAVASSPGKSPSPDSSALCSGMKQLKSDTAALRSLDPNATTLNQLKDSISTVQKDWQNIKDEAGNLSSSMRDSIKNATNDLQSAYQSLPSGTSGRQALNQLKPQIQNLSQAVQSAASSLHCPSSSP